MDDEWRQPRRAPGQLRRTCQTLVRRIVSRHRLCRVYRVRYEKGEHGRDACLYLVSVARCMHQRSPRPISIFTITIAWCRARALIPLALPLVDQALRSGSLHPVDNVRPPFLRTAGFLYFEFDFDFDAPRRLQPASYAGLGWSEGRISVGGGTRYDVAGAGVSHGPALPLLQV